MAKRKAKKSAEKEPHKLYLTYEEGGYGGGVCAGQEDEEWPDYDDEYITIDWKAAHRSDKDLSWFETVEVPFDPADVKFVFVVVLRYGSGNTFGHSSGHWDVEGIYLTPDEADAVSQKLHASVAAEPSTYPRKTVKEQQKAMDKATALLKGTKYEGQLFPPWRGYFECFEDVNIEMLKVQ